MLVRSGRYISKIISTVIIVGIIISALGACSQQSSTSSNVVKIGLTAPLTGDFSSDGVALKQGYLLWADAVNKRGGLLGRQVQMDIEDDQSKPDKATALYNNMVSNHDDLLFASFTDPLTVAGANVAKRNGYAFLEGAGTSYSTFHDGLNNLFAVSLSAQEYLTSFTSYIRSLPRAANQKALTIAYATSDDTFTKPQVDSAQLILEHANLPTVYHTVYPAETTDFNGIAQAIVAAKPDVVVLGTLGTADSVAFVKYFKQQQFNPKAIIATAGPDQGKQFTDALGGPQFAQDIFVPNDGWFPGINNYQNDQFTKDYLAKYGGTAADISSDTVQAYSVGQVMEQAVNKAQSLDNAKIMDALKANSFNTLQGPVKFASDGENSTASAFLFQWQNGELIPVFPANQAKNNPELQHYFGLTPPATS